jgi:tetratricopeptide (TPR) repeat protein
VTERRLQEALTCFKARDAAGAERACTAILRQSPGHPAALRLLGLVLISLGRPAEAIEVFQQVLRVDSGNPDAHLNLGNALADQNRREEALACYRQALKLNPDLVAAHVSIGRQLKLMGRLADAEAAFLAALALSPDHIDALINLGLVHFQQQRLDAAAAGFRKILALEPGHLLARNNLGGVLKAQGRHAEAIAHYEEAVKSHPGDADACINLGSIKAEQGRYAESQAWFEKALMIDPDNPVARNGLGNALSTQHSWDLAVAQYSRALALDPGLVEVQYNLGLVQLFRHEFETGWQGYEHRLQCPPVRAGLRKGAQTLDMYERLPRWRGPAEEPRREVAIWAEQGIGDQVLFSTLIPELIAAEVPFVYEVDRRLLAAYERAFPGARFIALSKPPLGALRLASRVLLAGSLPGLFRRSRESFSRQPRRLLGALPQRAAYYRNLFAAQGPGPKVALSWRSKNAAVRLGPGKNVPLMDFAPLLGVQGARFVDAQYGDTDKERKAMAAATGARLLHFDAVDYYNDLEELLAILDACDLVITTSNATAHLAGALGKRTWLLFLADRAPFYYWAHGGTGRSLWYPAVEIVTAPGLIEWKMLIEHAAQKLSRERMTRNAPT